MTANAELRPVPLPDGLPGRLVLSAIPGRFAPFESFADAIAAARVGQVLCLLEAAEIAAKSPSYAEGIAAGRLPARLHRFAIPDYGTPEDAAAFAAWLCEAGALLRDGEAVMHCAAGIGRTGMAASCMLRLLGLPLPQAEALVRAAGSGPETAAQRAFVAAFAPLDEAPRR